MAQATEYMKHPISEAIRAGEHALSLLHSAQHSLDSAAGWGILDFLGGGFFSTAIKRAKMKDARNAMDAARAALLTFQRELRDVSLSSDFGMDTGGVLSFADYVFDDLIVDLFVQHKIRSAQKQLNAAVRETERILGILREAQANPFS